MHKQIIVGRILTSICYVGLLMVFSFTSLFHEVILKGNQDFLPWFNSVQSTWPGYIVNIGLLLMLLIDYGCDKKSVPRWSLFLSILAFGAISLVFYFTKHADKVQSYNPPFNCPWLATVLYILFIVYLMFVKYSSFQFVDSTQRVKENLLKRN